MAVRTAKIEIYGFGKASGRRDNWRKLAVDCQKMTNRLWQIWLVHHVQNRSADKLQRHFEAFNAWKETKTGKKPMWPCQAAEHPLDKSSDSRSFYRILSAEFPNVHVKTRGLLLNAWQRDLVKRKAANGDLPGWVSILFANESLPSYTKPQPIPFDKENAKLFKKDGKYILELRIQRLEDGKSVVEPCELILGKRKCASVRRTVDKIIDGQFAWKGSNLVYKNGKWFAAIAYEMPVKVRPELDLNKVMYIRAGRKAPYRFSIGLGGSRPYGGWGNNIEAARRNVHRQRASRQEHYKWAGSSQKGHGGNRARDTWTKLSSQWKNYIDNYNNDVSRRLIRIAISEGCGRIVYFQPAEHKRESRFLTRVGNEGTSAPRWAKTTWTYEEFGKMLSTKCQVEGIEYGVEKRAKVAPDSVRVVRKTSKPKPGKRPKRKPAGM